MLTYLDHVLLVPKWQVEGGVALGEAKSGGLNIRTLKTVLDSLTRSTRKMQKERDELKKR